MQSDILAIVNPYVRILSVCLSICHTLALCLKVRFTDGTLDIRMLSLSELAMRD